MCGISGILRTENKEKLASDIKSITDAIAHRGPDDEGFLVNEEDGVALGHRRLSIIDLSDAANQPMFSKDGRFAIVYNGEIYNYVELREKLRQAGVTFRTTCDTEVLLELYIQKRENCLADLDGMFAFAIWDNQTKSLFCARDRFGEKPFFYAYEKGKYFIFASEIKSLKRLQGFADINKKMLYNYLAFGYVYNPDNPEETFFNKISKLPAGHYFILDKDFYLQKTCYWQLSIREDEEITFEEASKKLDHLFVNSVKRRLRSDVPVGSSLSGGIDSSLIVCLIDSFNKNNQIKQNTFSAKFPGFKKDESYFIDKILESTKANSYFVYPGEDGFLESFNSMCHHQDEPFGSASIFAQWEVMNLAKQNNVIVLLDGQGADEVFAGYHPYYTPYFQELYISDRKKYRRQWRKYKELQTTTINRDYKFYGGIYLKEYRQYFGWLKDKVDNKFRNVFHKDFYDGNRNYSFARSLKTEPSLSGVLYKSVTGGSLETLLRYADRNSMAHSREIRLPFLNHQLVEFLFTLPSDFKINEGWTKYILRKTFSNLLPQEIAWRKDKIGYEPPQKKWMQNSMIKDLIEESRTILVKERILDKAVLSEEIMPSDASERGNNSWNYLMAGKLFGL